MKINYDCVRALLLCLENELQFDDELRWPDLKFDKVCEIISNYSPQDIAYSSLMLSEADYINVLIVSGNNKFNGAIYTGITFEGHQYLDSIRSDKVWNKIKKKLSTEGVSLTLQIVKNVATSIITNSLLG